MNTEINVSLLNLTAMFRSGNGNRTTWRGGRSVEGSRAHQYVRRKNTYERDGEARSGGEIKTTTDRLEKVIYTSKSCAGKWRIG